VRSVHCRPSLSRNDSLGAIWNLRVRLVILRRISTGAFTGLAEFAVASGVCEITCSAEQCRSRWMSDGAAHACRTPCLNRESTLRHALVLIFVLIQPDLGLFREGLESTDPRKSKRRIENKRHT
jgi:hypothetical protein